MKIAIVGSTRYSNLMELYAKGLADQGIEVKFPHFDSIHADELTVAQRNRGNIMWADEIHVFWDRVSMGTVFDLGMAFAMFKKVIICKLEERTFSNLFEAIARASKEA